MDICRHIFIADEGASWTPLETVRSVPTGLASDVDHVSRVVQQGIHTPYHI
jgi:hypothetical protein